MRFAVSFFAIAAILFLPTGAFGDSGTSPIGSADSTTITPCLTPECAQPPQNDGGGCGATAPATDNGTWTCVDGYTTDSGTTVSYGDPGFTDPTSDPSVTQTTSTRKYQNDLSYLVVYGIKTTTTFTYLGTVRIKAHINFNGRQEQVNMGTLVTVGANIKPTASWTSSCGSGTASGSTFGLSWGGPIQTGFCAFDSSGYSNAYTYSWSSTANPGPFVIRTNSVTWTCNKLYTAPCFFGS